MMEIKHRIWLIQLKSYKMLNNFSNEYPMFFNFPPIKTWNIIGAEPNFEPLVKLLNTNLFNFFIDDLRITKDELLYYITENKNQMLVIEAHKSFEGEHINSRICLSMEILNGHCNAGIELYRILVDMTKNILFGMYKKTKYRDNLNSLYIKLLELTSIKEDFNMGHYHLLNNIIKETHDKIEEELKGFINYDNRQQTPLLQY